MKYRQLGKTALRVSEIGLGAEHLQGRSFDEVRAVTETALDGGVNIIDVFMPEYEVRSNIGRAITGRRHDVVLQAHIGAVVRGGQYARSRDPDECGIFLNEFLRAFETDYIDLGMLHFIDTDEDYVAAYDSGYFDYALGLKKSGLVRYIGASSHNPKTAARLVRAGLVDSLMFSINPAFDLLPADTTIDGLFSSSSYEHPRFEIDPDRAALYRLCEDAGIGITVMKPLGGGRLLSASASSFGFALTPAQCIGYALDRPAVASVLVGAKTPEEERAALAYETASASERDYSALASGTLSSMRGKCMYCNHCLPCPAGIDIASVTKYLDIARLSEKPSASLREHHFSLSSRGGSCISCGACEKRCPFGVAVRDNMRAAKEIFEKP